MDNEGTRLERWMHRLGYAAEWLGSAAQAAAGSATDTAAHLSDEVEDAADIAEPAAVDSALSASASLLAGTVAARIASRVLQPRDVRWPRAILAGVIGTLLYDAEMAVDQRLTGRKFDTIRPLGQAFSEDPEVQRWAGWAAHYAAGVGLAVFYARYLHGRLPGPHALHGTLFGLADAAVLSWGGLLPLLSQVAPDVSIPAGYAGLAHAPTVTAQSLLRHGAYGLGVGMVYRPEE